MTNIKTPLYFTLLTFGRITPDAIASVEAAVGLSADARYNNRPLCYRRLKDASAVAVVMHGYGSVNAVRIAVVYDDGASPDISRASGPGWELYSLARSRAIEAAYQAGCEAVYQGLDPTRAREYFRIHERSYGDWQGILAVLDESDAEDAFLEGVRVAARENQP